MRQRHPDTALSRSFGSLVRTSLVAAVAALTPGTGMAQDVNPFGRMDFRSIGPATMSGRIVDLAVVEGSPDVFYVASSTGGLWKTTTRGVTPELAPLAG